MGEKRFVQMEEEFLFTDNVIRKSNSESDKANRAFFFSQPRGVSLGAGLSLAIAGSLRKINWILGK